MKKWLPLIILSLALAVVTMDMTITQVSLDAIIRDLHTDLRTFQWVVTSYSLVLAALTITGGRLGDMFGRKKMFLIGAALFAIGSLMGAIAQQASVLLAGVGVVEGVGAALMLPATSALILAAYQQKKERAIAFGVYAGVAGVAASIGPLLGGWLTSHYSWRWSYLINPFIILLLFAGAKVIRESRETDHRPSLDIMSVLLSAVGLGAMVFGIIESSAYGWFRPKADFALWGQSLNIANISVVFWALMTSVVLLSWFVWRQWRLERRGLMPLVSLKLLTNRQFMSGATTNLILTASQFGIIFVLFVFWQVARGYDAFHSGLAGIVLPLSILVAAPLGGVLTGVAGRSPRLIIQAGIVLSFIGILWFHNVASVTTSAGELAPALLFFGLGFGLTLSPIANLTLSAVSVQEGGEASGVNNTYREIGSSFGQALLGAILIASLGSLFTLRLTSSPTLPAPVKAVAAQAFADGQAQDPKVQQSLAQLPVPMQHELQNIQHESAAKGVQDALLIGSALSGASFVGTLWLPRRPRQSAVALP